MTPPFCLVLKNGSLAIQSESNFKARESKHLAVRLDSYRSHSQSWQILYHFECVKQDLDVLQKVKGNASRRNGFEAVVARGDSVPCAIQKS